MDNKKPKLNFKQIIKDGLKYSRYEKIENGTYNFLVDGVELSQTLRSKKQCITYYGRIENSKGEMQESKMTDSINTTDNAKFGISRLIKFINHFGLATTKEIENAESVEELINIANKAIGKVIKIKFMMKLINGIVITEKSFIYE